MAQIDEWPCTRHKAVIGGENFYFIVGENFIHPTVPDENKAKAQKLRQTVEEVCHILTQIMGGEDE